MTLIDTSAWIEFLRPNGDVDVKLAVGDLVRLGQAAFTCPVRYELQSGARPNEQSALDVLFGVTTHLPVEAADWNRAAQLRSTLIRNGKTVALADLLIFCVAERHGIPFISKDGHFVLIQEASQA
jgi:predicted nucleic acid-binding protein